MPNFRLSLGPLRASLFAGRQGAEMRFGVGGPRWLSWYEGVAAHRRARREADRPLAEVPPPEEAGAAADLRRRIATLPWYHVIDLGHGVVTPGIFDHRPVLPRYPLPDSLAGQRVLDIGTFDGFWAFEFEKRGAAEVVALDIATFSEADFPPPARARMAPAALAEKTGRGFAIAHDVLGSHVERRTGSVYRLDPAEWGRFDLVNLGNVLVHLRDPALALQCIRPLVRGRLMITETIDQDLEAAEGMGPLMRYMGGEQDCNWWRYNSAALLRMPRDAGFAATELATIFRLPMKGGARDMTQAVVVASP
ncbi:class I SAM-dependent methyltransferase [Roseomonas sp. HJA6]|uniref:Class I SAM-dependent methyltransferase n=1 Tax=Roseomonas alba TaxID=2846776 RepID=A0ABS7A632_9PROT|nr:methyltransferase domain-containing protein [Neoroseomonas alba]MBW6397764.1 class I SAM-dependent methyltransferase [Neoroseomonas alba]